ncbi:hypothetical protein A0H81_08553 [Grifola frondosa]|uniref:Uncharacterized protein n=1 Tax=Grifola frondosa TaxID=5627 RepID=A0A1C7M2J1_GRIFR|nr:hypothetical protein A0H81_08553 [Grifola frondosa]
MSKQRRDVRAFYVPINGPARFVHVPFHRYQVNGVTDICITDSTFAVADIHIGTEDVVIDNPPGPNGRVTRLTLFYFENEGVAHPNINVIEHDAGQVWFGEVVAVRRGITSGGVVNMRRGDDILVRRAIQQ